MENLGIITIIPPILALVLALVTKNIFLALFLGIVTSSILANGWGFIGAILDEYIFSGISGNLDMFVFMIIFGAILAAIKMGGGFSAFSKLADKSFNTPKKVKFLTWLLSGVVINQGFGTIGIGSIMRPTTDKHRISREKLGYILSSTAEPVCALVPFTIYILVFSGLISAVLPDMDGQAVYLQSIKYNFFCVLSIVAALLTALEVLPDFGYMKKRELAAKEKGEVIRPGSVPLEAKELEEMEGGDQADILSFLLPILCLIVSLIVIRVKTGMFSLMTPSLIAFIVAVAYPVFRGYFSFNEVPGLLINGGKSMMSVVILLSLAFGFGKAVAAAGFADYIVGVTQGILTPTILPAAVFVICAVASYATGSLISACFLLGPIALMLAAGSGANIPLVLGALVGGSTFGDITSPLSDMVIESATGAGVDVLDLGKAQLMPRIVLAAITTVLYLIVGIL